MNTLKIAENTEEDDIEGRGPHMSSTISKMSAGINIKANNKTVLEQ
jgi:hypothetical protein